MSTVPSVEDFIQACRRHSTRTVLFHAAIAERMGLNPSDHKCMDVILERVTLTAGQLAELTGLSTGAITGVVDRLERVGLVARESDPSDRRKVILRATPERCRHLWPLFSGLANATARLHAAYRPEELALLMDFLDRSSKLLEEETQALREGPPLQPHRDAGTAAPASDGPTPGGPSATANLFKVLGKERSGARTRRGR